MTKSIAERTGRRSVSMGFVVRGWMYSPSGLGLYGDVLIIYAQIYETSQNERALWIMSAEWVAEGLGIEPADAQKIVDDLIARGLVHERGICTDGRMLLAVDQDVANAAMASEIMPEDEPGPTGWTLFPRGKKKPYAPKLAMV